MMKCGVIVFLVGTAFFGVEGMRLKTAKEDILGKTGDEELLDFDHMPDKADMDLYAEKTGSTACTKSDLPTDADWKALATNTMKTPSNYCHKQLGDSYFCFSGVCKDLGTAGSGGCTLAETIPSDFGGYADKAEYCEETHTGNQENIDDCKTGGKRTEDGWWWDMLQYDSNFACSTPITEDSCTGPYPSLSCGSRDKTARTTAGLMARDPATSYCYAADASSGSTAAKCYDVMVDYEICRYAPGGWGGPLSKGRKTSDGWTLKDQGYDLGIGCTVTSMNAGIKAALNAFGGQDQHEGTLSLYVDQMFEPTREVFMELYPMRHQLYGWMNKKQESGFRIDTRYLGNLEHKSF